MNFKKIFLIIIICYIYCINGFAQSVDPRIISSTIAESILRRDINTLVLLTKLPCSIKGKKINNEPELTEVWNNAVQKITPLTIKLLNIKTMPVREAVKFFGQLPQRFSSVPANSVVSILIFNRFMLIIFLVPERNSWKIQMIDEQ